jgi:hypothetical protein
VIAGLLSILLIQPSLARALTAPYFRATRSYLETHGKPVAFYSDKHSIFRVNNKDAVGGDGITQFGRALSALNIDTICANSPQAKGRVERTFGTLQDRLVKELRLACISTIEATAQPCGAATTAEQSRGAGTALGGTRATPRRCRCLGLTSPCHSVT